MKKIIKVFLTVMMVAVLTGCMKVNMNVEVQEDLTTKMNLEVLMEESLIKAQGENSDDVINSMKEEFSDNEGLENVQVTSVTKTIDGNQWLGINVEGTAKKDDASVAVKKETVDGKEQIVLTLPMDEMNDEMDMSSLAAAGYSVDKLKALGMEMNVVIKMPGDVTCNVGTVKGDTVTIDLLELMASGKTDDIVVTAIPSSGMNMGLILGVVAVVAVIAVVAVVLKKKKGNEQPVEEFVAPVQEEPVVEETVEEPVQEDVVEEEKNQEESE